MESIYSDTNTYAASTNIAVSYSATRSGSGEYSYPTKRFSPSHYLPERK
jgi:hypothetical protein